MQREHSLLRALIAVSLVLLAAMTAVVWYGPPSRHGDHVHTRIDVVFYRGGRVQVAMPTVATKKIAMTPLPQLSPRHPAPTPPPRRSLRPPEPLPPPLPPSRAAQAHHHHRHNQLPSDAFRTHVDAYFRGRSVTNYNPFAQRSCTAVIHMSTNKPAIMLLHKNPLIPWQNQGSWVPSKRIYHVDDYIDYFNKVTCTYLSSTPTAILSHRTHIKAHTVFTSPSFATN